jgi:hypothetical protein
MAKKRAMAKKKAATKSAQKAAKKAAKKAGTRTPAKKAVSKAARKTAGKAARKAAPKAGRKAPARKAAPKSGRKAARKAAPARKAVKKVARAKKAAPKKVSAPLIPRQRKVAAAPPRRATSPAPVRGRIPSSLNPSGGSSAARSGREELLQHIKEHTETSPAITAGDVDADWQLAYSSGDEAPGGDNPTPDQDVVDEIGEALGVQYEDGEELKGASKIEARDKHRWELDPASKDDFDE